MDKFHIAATSHWPNYLPEYVAKENGYFQDEDLEFSRSAPEDWTRVLDDLAAGQAQAVLGGIWVPAMYHRHGREYVAFAQLNARNPKTIVARTPNSSFVLSDLEGKVVLAPGAGGTAPYTHTAGLIRSSGADLGAVRFIRDLGGSTLSELFVGGLGDYVIVDVVNAHLLEAKGAGHVVYRHTEAGGPMPNSVYYTEHEAFGAPESPVWRFTRAIQRGMDWLNAHTGEDSRDLLARTWPGVAPDVLVRSVDDLRESGVWTDVRIDRDAFDSWMAILAGESLVNGPVAYEDIVDPRPADAALASLR